MAELNDDGLNLIKSFESLRLTAYPDPGTGGDPWTIGYGHTGPDVTEGMTCDQDQADAWLQEDLQSAIDGVTKLVTSDINDNQFSALVSFAYNCGLGNLKTSTLLKDVNTSNFDAAAQEFLKWDHANGQVMPGLLRRRTAESNLFSS